MSLREEPIRSQKYLRGANGASCKFMAPGICCGDDETTVFAHLNGDAFGKAKGRKSHDIAGLDACFACHTYIDIGHGRKPLMSDADFHWLLLRGVVLTMVDRARRQIIIVPQDIEATFHSKSAPKRKAKEDGTPVRPSRPLSTGNHQHTATTPPTKTVRQFARAHGDTK